MSNIRVGVATSNRGGLATIMGADGGAGGNIFPFGGLIVVNIEDMAWLNGGGIFGEDATPCEATANTGTKSKIERQTFMKGGLIDGSKIGVVFEDNGASEQIF